MFCDATSSDMWWGDGVSSIGVVVLMPMCVCSIGVFIVGGGASAGTVDNFNNMLITMMLSLSF